MMRLAVAQSSPWPYTWWLQISAVPSVDSPHWRQSGISGPRLEAPLVEVQRLDLRLQRRRRHPEPPGRAEGPGHAALASVSAASMASFWWVASVPVERLATGAVPGDRPASHRASIESVSESHTITARSMTFCNSRMLPGQSYD